MPFVLIRMNSFVRMANTSQLANVVACVWRFDSVIFWSLQARAKLVSLSEQARWQKDDQPCQEFLNVSLVQFTPDYRKEVSRNHAAIGV
jgi:hypothetical protein